MACIQYCVCWCVTAYTYVWCLHMEVCKVSGCIYMATVICVCLSKDEMLVGRRQFSQGQSTGLDRVP